MEKWISVETSDIAGMLLSAFVVYLAIILYCRIFGLRSFSKMSAADFAMTLAVGSLFASIIASPSPSLLLGLLALAFLFFLQWSIAHLRRMISGATKWLDNTPVLLVRDGKILHENLKITGVTQDDLMAKLREANAFTMNDVAAVVFETTGDVTVLHKTDRSFSDLDSCILEGVFISKNDEGKG